MKIKSYEGGIPYEVDIPDHIWAATARMNLDDLPCSCGGEYHDECRPCAECGETPALNDLQDDPDGGCMYLCDECYEAVVIAEEAAYAEARAEEERQSFDWIREDHEAQAFDDWWQRQKEEWE